MKYFNDCTTLAEVKSVYKDLAKQFHPDLHPEAQEKYTAIMQEINREYDFATRKLISGEDLSAEDIEASILEVEEYRIALNKVLPLEGLTIEIVGNWIWVRGNTYAHRKTLADPEGGKFTWAKKEGARDAWFFRTEQYRTRGKSNMTLDDIKKKYGSTEMKGQAPKNRLH